MEVLILSVALVGLLLLNGFFVLAEFSIVKVRKSRVAELIDGGDERAKILGPILDNLDEYLSICQVGITFASVALGMVGKRISDDILGGGGDASLARTIIAIGVSYVIVSGGHIVIGELVPKSIAIRISDRASLWSAKPLRFFRLLFFPALWALNGLANAILKVIAKGWPSGEEKHSEDELRIILEHSQEQGMLSFRRLLLMENVFDFGTLVVKDTMRPRKQVKCLDANAPWADNLKIVREARFTRYPVIAGDPERPVGMVHVKSILLAGTDAPPDLRALARPIVTTSETTSLEALFAELQKKRSHAAMVCDESKRWTGFVTLEDVIEELVGTIVDEFEEDPPVSLADTLAVDRVHLGVEAESSIAAVKLALGRMSKGALPIPADVILRGVEEREKAAPTYLGEGIALPHARIQGLSAPFTMVLRSENGVPCVGAREQARLLFVLVTPAGQPRIHQRLQATIARLIQESDYVKERLLTATTAQEVLEAIRAGEQTSLD